MAGVLIHEVGLRDGLQMEEQVVPTDRKLQWLEGLLASGVDIIQVGSFVHPVRVPQMADTDELFRRLGTGGAGRRPVLSALVLNDKGLARGLAVGVEMFCMGVSASETHSRKNTGKPSSEAAQQIIDMARRAQAETKRVQVSVQSAFGCGYEGAVPEQRVIDLVNQFLDSGVRTLSLADTAGHAIPQRVETMFGAILEMGDDVECAGHFHNTYGLAMANAYAAVKAGVRYLESSLAGLGGCPFTAVAGGNLCSEDLLHYLHQSGSSQHVDLERMIELARDIGAFFGRDLPGSVYKTGPIPSAPSRSADGSR